MVLGFRVWSLQGFSVALKRAGGGIRCVTLVGVRRNCENITLPTHPIYESPLDLNEPLWSPTT